MTYVLVALVVAIWGILTYRVVSGLSGNDDEDFESEVEMVPHAVAKVDNFDYELSLNYRDPFLGRSYRRIPSLKPSTNSVQKQTSAKKETPENKPVRTDHIKFKGLIEDNKTKKTVVLLSVNNHDYLLNAEDEIEQIRLIEIFEDSIKIKIEDNYAVIHKE